MPGTRYFQLAFLLLNGAGCNFLGRFNTGVLVRRVLVCVVYLHSVVCVVFVYMLIGDKC